MLLRVVCGEEEREKSSRRTVNKWTKFLLEVYKCILDLLKNPNYLIVEKNEGGLNGTLELVKLYHVKILYSFFFFMNV